MNDKQREKKRVRRIHHVPPLNYNQAVSRVMSQLNCSRFLAEGIFSERERRRLAKEAEAAEL